jgi:hypothetical protein
MFGSGFGSGFAGGARRRNRLLRPPTLYGDAEPLETLMESPTEGRALTPPLQVEDEWGKEDAVVFGDQLKPEPDSARTTGLEWDDMKKEAPHTNDSERVQWQPNPSYEDELGHSSPDSESMMDKIDRKIAAYDNPAQPREAMIEIAPGVSTRLRGAKETWEAVLNDFYIPATCFVCSSGIFVIQDARFVLW